MAANLATPPIVHRRRHALADAKRAATHDTDMDDRLAQILRVFDFEGGIG